MNSIRTLLAALTLTVVSFAAAAQVAPQFEIGPGKGTVVGPQAADIAAKKAAAEQWLAKDQFGITWKPALGSSGSTQQFTAYPKKSKVKMYANNRCFLSGENDVTFFFDDRTGRLVVQFPSILQGCPAGAYTFDPVSGDGETFIINADGTLKRGTNFVYLVN